MWSGTMIKLSLSLNEGSTNDTKFALSILGQSDQEWFLELILFFHWDIAK